MLWGNFFLDKLKTKSHSMPAMWNFISKTAVWTIVEEDTFKGKQAIIENCEQVSSYFKSVTTDFKTLNIIAEGNKVVITEKDSSKESLPDLTIQSNCFDVPETKPNICINQVDRN